MSFTGIDMQKIIESGVFHVFVGGDFQANCQKRFLSGVMKMFVSQRF